MKNLECKENERKSFYDCEDVMRITHFSKTKSYEIIKMLNEELKKKNYLTLRSRVSSTYFHERLNIE